MRENTEHFTVLSEYDVTSETTVKFKAGSSRISPEYLEELKQLAQTTTNITGYIVEVLGFADARGGATLNEKLSEDRSKAVVSFLIQQCNVPVRQVVAPGTMGGQYPLAASNETKEGGAENRRVVVRVLVNKGFTGI